MAETDLEDLGRDLQSEVARLRRIQAEIDKRTLERAIEFYSPHPRQAAFHKDASRIRVVTGGNRSGKTHSSQAEGYAYALGYRPWLPEGHPDRDIMHVDGRKLRPPIKIMVAGESYDHIQRVILTKLMGDPETGWPGIIRKGDYDPKKGTRRNQAGVINWLRLNNGTTYTFQSYDQDKDKFESTDWDLVIFDEPPPQAVWTATWRGMADRMGRVIFAMTPLKEPWIFYKIIQSKELDVGYHAFHTRDNVGFGLTERSVDEMAAGFDPSERETRLEGKFLHLQGLIYPSYMQNREMYRRPRATLLEMDRRGRPYVPKSWGLWMAIDPHPRVPHHALWIAARPDDRLIVCGELQADDRENSARRFGQRCTTYEREFLGVTDHNAVERLIDPSSRTNNPVDGRSVWDVFAEEGLVCRNGSKDLHGCIDATREVFRYEPDQGIYPTLFFCDDLPGIDGELCSYIWDEWATRQGEQKTAKQAPRDKDDHFIENMHRIIKDGPRAPRDLDEQAYLSRRNRGGDALTGY